MEEKRDKWKTDGRIDGWIDGQRGWMEGLMKEWINGQKDG